MIFSKAVGSSVEKITWSKFSKIQWSSQRRRQIRAFSRLMYNTNFLAPLDKSTNTTFSQESGTDRKGCATLAEEVATTLFYNCELSYAHVLGEVGEDTPRRLIGGRRCCSSSLFSRYFLRREAGARGERAGDPAGQICDFIFIPIVDVTHQLKPLAM